MPINKTAMVDPDYVSRFTEHYNKWKDCVLCSIGESCTQKVFCRGNVPCDVLFIGEAPGVQEDREGYPFIGRSGQLLQRMIDEVLKNVGGVGFTYAIANVVLCRPFVRRNGMNRRPTQGEVSRCRKHLVEFIRLSNPVHIIAVGTVARQWILDDKRVLHIRQDNGEIEYTSFITINHPAYILRNGGAASKMYASDISKMTEFLNHMDGVLE
jgi:DNA polymerase